MKAKLFAMILLTATVVTVALYPGQRSGAYTGGNVKPPPTQVDPLVNDQPVIEVVFVLDTTGSMGNLIAAAKDKIWSIASGMASAKPTPEVRMGLVAYRDRGDDYVTRVVDLSTDLDAMYMTLMQFEAAGGGDGPESVNRALSDAVHEITWSDDPSTYRTIFLVGDAPPHMDYVGEKQYPQLMADARQRDIVVNTIQCGKAGVTRVHWTHIAQLADGRYFDVEQDGSALAIATPFDDQIAELSRELDETRLYYGSREEREVARQKVETASELHRRADKDSRARRAVFNASEGGRKNFLGDKELVDDVATGRVGLEEIPTEALPETLQAMAPEDRSAAITEQARKRSELTQRIQELAKSRESFIQDKLDEVGGAEASLDYKIYSAVREQAEAKGLEMEEEPDY